MDFEISPNSSIKTRQELEKKFGKFLRKNIHVLRITGSICPECIEEGETLKDSKLDALVYEENGKVWIVKECLKHGVVKDLYWGDYKMYERARRFADPGIKLLNPEIDKPVEKISCPDDCGLCAKHRSHTNLGNIVVTNRCDLSCWYCFFYAKEGEAIYEPTLDQIRMMLRRMKNQRPVPCNAVQITGGEPTLRDDIVEIVKICKEEGFDHVQFNTNGIAFSKNLKLVKDLKRVGSKKGSIIAYLSFDGVTPETNPKNYWEIPDILENCRKVGFQLVLVPTIIGGVNDHELGDIIRFAFDNNDVIRGVNFQPVSLVGRMPRKEREKRRITIPDACRKIQEQTKGDISMEDFFTVPSTTSITNFIEAVKDQSKYRLSTHFACGVATYVFRDKDKMIPITRFVDVDGLFKYLDELAVEIKDSRFKKAGRTISSLRLLWNIKKFVDDGKKPKELNLMKLLVDAFGKGNFTDIAEFQLSSLFVGMMHFQDLYNYDIDRVQRCCIHYAVPDGRLIPFCAFNVIPQVFRDKTQKEFSVPAREWEKKNSKRLKDDKYIRRLDEKKKKKIMRYYKKII